MSRALRRARRWFVFALAWLGSAALATLPVVYMPDFWGSTLCLVVVGSCLAPAWFELLGAPKP